MVSKAVVVKSVIKVSKIEYPDEVIVVFQKSNGDYSWVLEANYIGDEDRIFGRYLNGKLAPE
jgi:hypothetical protein